MTAAHLPGAILTPRCRTHGGQVMRRVGKHSAGRLLDGVEHNGVPA